MRASVLVKMPHFQRKPEVLRHLAAKYHVQIRGIHGERTYLDYFGIFDVSNSRRLGRTEMQLIDDMV